MSIDERIGYLKGVFDCMNVDANSPEGKFYRGVIDCLSELAEDLADTQDYIAELTEQVDAVDEDLDALEQEIYEECDGDCEDCDCEGDCEGCCGCGDEDDIFEVTCPHCGEEFQVDEETLLDGSVDCPACGELLEFDFDEDDDAEADDAE